MDKKVERIIKLYSRFLEGKVINKKVEAERFEVNRRTIQRDIDDIRMYFADDMNVNWQVVYDRNKNGYVLMRDSEENLNGQEILMLCKVFMKSRLLVKEEMFSVVDKLVQICTSSDEKKKIAALLAKEKLCYEGPGHGKKLQQMIKDISDAIYSHRVVQIYYQIEEKEESAKQIVQPMGIIFAENYFYLAAYMNNDNDELQLEKPKENRLPVIYRLDKITGYSVLQKHFRVPYKSQYEEADFWSLIEEETAVSKEEV